MVKTAMAMEEEKKLAVTYNYKIARTRRNYSKEKKVKQQAQRLIEKTKLIEKEAHYGKKEVEKRTLVDPSVPV